MNFYPSYIFHFRSFDCPLGSHPGSLQQECDPYKHLQNSNKSRLCFFTHQTFSIFAPLVAPWDPILDPCGKSVILTSACKIQIKVVWAFYPSDIFYFCSFGCPLGSHPGSLRQKCDPDKYSQKSNEYRLCFLPIRHFPFPLLRLSLGIPSWVLAAKVWSWQVFTKFQ